MTHENQSAADYHHQGTVHFELERYDEAIASFDRSLEISPENYDGWNTRGLALVGLGRHEEAIGSYDKALEIHPNYSDVW